MDNEFSLVKKAMIILIFLNLMIILFFALTHNGLAVTNPTSSSKFIELYSSEKDINNSAASLGNSFNCVDFNQTGSNCFLKYAVNSNSLIGPTIPTVLINSFVFIGNFIFGGVNIIVQAIVLLIDSIVLILFVLFILLPALFTTSALGAFGVILSDIYGFITIIILAYAIYIMIGLIGRLIGYIKSVLP